MISRIQRLPKIDTFRPEACLGISVLGLDEVSIFLQMVALQSYMVSTVAFSVVCATIHELEAQFIIFAQR